MASLLARTVHVIISVATLLSGEMDGCFTPSDPSCMAGVAAVGAFARNETGNDASLVLPFFDKSSRFVQSHPLGWSVNRLVLKHMMGWPVFLSPPGLLTQHSGDFNISSRDLSDLQSTEFPFLLSNVGVPPSNSWSQFIIPVFFHEATGLAVLSIFGDKQEFNIPQVEATLGLLDYIERINQRAECSTENTKSSLFDAYVNRTTTERTCWIPIIVYIDIKENFLEWLPPVVDHEHRPALIVHIEESQEESVEPVMVQGVWVVTFEENWDEYSQVTIDIAEGGREVLSVELVQRDMGVVPDELKDDIYNDHIMSLRALADEAMGNDPTVGQSVFIPAQREGTYRRCNAGDCEIGKLFNDAARWYTQSDVAFQASGGFRGPGWDAGGVKMSDIWSALPFDNNLCTGVISGVSLFRLFNYSLTYSTFEGENTDLGDRLFQVSGLRISYNLQLESTSRLVKMEIWKEDTQNYTDVERLGLYTFVTDSYVCFGFDQYPVLLGDETLTLPGEKPGSIEDDIILQAVVADYFAHLEVPYDPSLPGSRLVNRTDLVTPLNLIQTPESCLTGYYWEAELASCFLCPTESTVTFLSERLEFQADELTSTKTIKLVNPALFDVEVSLKSKPAWVSVESVTFGNSERVASFAETPSVELPSGETLIISFRTSTTSLEPGTAQGTVVFGSLDRGQYPGCTSRDARFEIFARKYPPEESNQLGNLRYVGVTMAILAGMLSLFLTGWVFRYRQIQVVRTLQPTFLVTISMGVLVMALAMIPMSIDDEIASQRISDMSCMSLPWLLSLGFSFAMSALFAKLWRIERLFRATSLGRRVKVEVKDVLGPIAIMLVLNVGVLLSWTLVSPLRFQRRSLDSEPWKSYGVCRSSDETFGQAMMIAVLLINLTCLVLASYMAYSVRNVSDEFSESKRLGLALFCWMQLLLVAGPMLLLIDDDNPSARYFLQTGVIFAVCVSMLCFIFVPIIWLKGLVSQQYSQSNLNVKASRQNLTSSMRSSKPFTLRDTGVRVSGINFSGQISSAAPVSVPQAGLPSSIHDGRQERVDDTNMLASEHLGTVNEEANSEEERSNAQVRKKTQQQQQDNSV